MRLLTALAAAVLLGSLFLASRHRARRAPSFPIGRFVTEDPSARVRVGKAEKALGVEMSGCEDLVRERPGDMDALRARIRVGFLLGSVGLAQPRVPEIVRAQSDAYLEHRERIDPDGTFLGEAIRQWADARLRLDRDHQTSFYACAAAGIFLGARGEPKARETLFEITRQGDFHLQFFPFARRYHPGWPIVEPLVTHYLEHGDLAGRAEAGVTLLEYHDLFGVGGDLFERFLPVIRDSVREMLERVHALTDEGASQAGRTAVVGMALLASRGDADQMRLLAEAKDERVSASYAPHVDTVRIARLWTGLEDFASIGPLSVRFKDMDPFDQETYYLAVAHRAQHLLRQGGATEELSRLLDVLESAFDGTVQTLRVLAMQALLRLAPERGAALVRRALDARGPFAVYAGALAERVDDPVALFLPYLGSPTPDVAAISAASLLDLPFPHALQR